MWQYLLHQEDMKNLKRWICLEFYGQETDLNEATQSEETLWLETNYRSHKSLARALFPVEQSTGMSKSERTESAVESKYSTFNLLSGPLYGSDLESLTKSQDSFDSSSQGYSVATDTWSVQSFEAYDTRETAWSTELFTPIRQSMVDLVLISKEPFVEFLLNLLARCGVFTTKEKNEARLLMRRLLVSGAFESVRNFNGSHECQVSCAYIQQVILEFLLTHKFIMPAFDCMNEFILDSSEEKAVQTLELPTWAKMIAPFVKLLKTNSRRNLYDLSLRNLELLSETCQSPQTLQFPAFLTMLFAPTKNLQDFMEFDVSSLQHCEDEEIRSLCSILDKLNMSPDLVVQGVVEKYPNLRKMFPRAEGGTSLASLDVNMYDLLHGTVSYDISRIFTFQKNNR